MSGTVYGFPRARMCDGVPVVSGEISPRVTKVSSIPGLVPVLNGNLSQTVTSRPGEEPGFRPVWAALTAVLLIDVVLAVVVASVWR